MRNSKLLSLILSAIMLISTAIFMTSAEEHTAFIYDFGSHSGGIVDKQPTAEALYGVQTDGRKAFGAVFCGLSVN